MKITKKNMINVRTESSLSDLSNTLRKRNLVFWWDRGPQPYMGFCACIAMKSFKKKLNLKAVKLTVMIDYSCCAK